MRGIYENPSLFNGHIFHMMKVRMLWKSVQL